MKKLILSIVATLVLIISSTTLIFAQGKGKAVGQPKRVSPRSENAKQHMSIVAQEVEELLTTQGSKGGIGQQISQIAQEQQQAQAEIEEELDELESQPGWLKKLFGPNQKSIKNIDKKIEQNQLRIQQLNELQNQVQNQADQTQIQQTTQALVQQNTALQEQIQAEEQVGSVFGWIKNLFGKK
jgi:chromosome segregation ATPase